MKEKLLKALQLIDQLERKCRDLEVREDEDFAEIKALVAEALAYYPETPFPTYIANPGTPYMPGIEYPPPAIMTEGSTNQEQGQKDSGYTPWYTYVGGPQATDDHNQYVGGPAGKWIEGKFDISVI